MADDDTVARIARAVVVPNCRRVDFVDMPSIVPCVYGTNRFVVRNHLTHLIRDNHGNILALSELCDDFGTGRAAEAVERPEGFQVADHIVGFVTFKKIKHLGLRGLTKRLSFGDDKVAALLLGHQGGLLRQVVVVVAFRHHHDDVLEIVGLAKQCTEAKSQEKD